MIIRAFLLEKKDLFLKQGTIYIVIRVNKIEICFQSFSRDNFCASGPLRTMGVNSREKLELVERESIDGYVANQSAKKKTKKNVAYFKPVNNILRKADKLRLTTSSHF